jgi:hypothetical protein
MNQYQIVEDMDKLLRIRAATENPVKRQVYDNALREMKATMDYCIHHAVYDDDIPAGEMITPAFIVR